MTTLTDQSTQDYAKFRQEVRVFLHRALPAEMAERVRRSAHTRRSDVSAWMRTLYDRGWAAVGWPVEYGGPGWDGFKRIIFEEECVAADAPAQHFANIHSVGPVIYTYGTAQQKDRLLVPILKGDDIWCQGFSEPNAGSDLSSLSTKAIREDGHYLVNGQKLWTSDAGDADWMFALVRTSYDGKPQRGISFLLIDMNTPGVEVRPIRMIDGSQVVNEVFLQDVRVPVDNLVGTEGQGWEIAKFLLASERAFSAEVPYSKRDLSRLIAIAQRPRGEREPIWNDPIFKSKVVRLYCDLLALEYSMIRALNEIDAGGSPVASILKVPGSEIRQRVAELTVEALGEYGVVRDCESGNGIGATSPGPDYARGASATFLYRRATTIYGGANEVQRNIIAKSILGL